MDDPQHDSRGSYSSYSESPAQTRHLSFRTTTRSAAGLHERLLFSAIPLAQPMPSFMWWTTYFLLYSTDHFLQEFIQTWHEELCQRGTVISVNIFVSDQHLCVPIAFDSGKETVGTDWQTFEALHMWYSLMRVKRGLSEIILPRRLVRVDKVGVSERGRLVRLDTYDPRSFVVELKALSASVTALKLSVLVGLGQAKLRTWWSGGLLVHVNHIKPKPWSQTPVPRVWSLSAPETLLLYH